MAAAARAVGGGPGWCAVRAQGARLTRSTAPVPAAGAARCAHARTRAREREGRGGHVEGDVVTGVEDGVQEEVHGGGVARQPPREERVPPAVEAVQVRGHGGLVPAAVVELPQVEVGMRLREQALNALAHPPCRVQLRQIPVVEHHGRPWRWLGGGTAGGVVAHAQGRARGGSDGVGRRMPVGLFPPGADIESGRLAVRHHFEF